MRRRIFIVLLGLAVPVVAFAVPIPVISEAKALALIQALPEFSELRQRLKDDVSIDGPSAFTPDPLTRVGLGSTAWQIDVYTIVHDDAETAHGVPWAFFRVNGTSGDIWVSYFDFDRGDFALRSLQEWRRQREKSKRPQAGSA